MMSSLDPKADVDDIVIADASIVDMGSANVQVVSRCLPPRAIEWVIAKRHQVHF